MRPAQERAKGVLAEAERQEEQGQIYADSLALINSVEAFCTPIGKLYAHNLLAKAYYFLGTYYWGQTGEYSRAAKCYTQAEWLSLPSKRTQKVSLHTPKYIAH